MSWKKAEEVRPEIYNGDSITTAIVMFSTFMLIVVGFMGMWADYSGILRYLILLTLVSMALMIPAYLLFQSSAKSRIKAENTPESMHRGNLDELNVLVKRALGGYNASQVMLEDRLREDLIQRIATRRRVPVELVRERSRDWEGAMLISGDEDLAMLLFNRKRMGGGKRVLFIRPSKGYREWINRVMDKMEEWK